MDDPVTYRFLTGTVDDVVGRLDGVVTRTVSVARHVDGCVGACGLCVCLCV